MKMSISVQDSALIFGIADDNIVKWVSYEVNQINEIRDNHPLLIKLDNALRKVDLSIIDICAIIYNGLIDVKEINAELDIADRDKCGTRIIL